MYSMDYTWNSIDLEHKSKNTNGNRNSNGKMQIMNEIRIQFEVRATLVECVYRLPFTKISP